jgi:hypothetical protein
MTYVKHSMTAAEEEAWVRGGGRPPSNIGIAYDPTAHIRAALTVRDREERSAERERARVERDRARAERAARPKPEPKPRRLPPVKHETLYREQVRDTVNVTHLPVATRVGHGTLRDYLAGCHCLDCTNGANEAAMLGEYRP